MFNKKFLFLAILFPVLGFSQDCRLSFEGFVKDLSTGLPISDASIYVKENQSGATSDSLGYFKLSNFCKGEYHVNISHVGCDSYQLFIKLNKDTSFNIALDHHNHLLDEVALIEEAGSSNTEAKSGLDEHDIENNAAKQLAAQLDGLSGVSMIKTGSGIAKPVVHGLFGNRLAILNNGIVQSGQQWGSDHAPEIDPLVANTITVIKGVSSLQYPGSSLGSVILVQPKKVDREPHLHGSMRYFFETNGRGNGLNAEVQKQSKWFSWRLSGTLKASGDKHTPDYYLNNTGNREGNLALQIEKDWSERMSTELYISSFNTRLGILRGAHIGNLTDLETALNSDVPLFTEDAFSYEIESPNQLVNHQLIKLKNKFRYSEKHWWEFTYAHQLNNRKEFDVRRSGRSDTPALSLKLNNDFLELKQTSFISELLEFNGAIQFTSISNRNNPETGILPLIPDYNSRAAGLFAMLSRKLEKGKLELGARYDYENRFVAAISNSTPREVIRYANNYQNIGLMLGMQHRFSETISSNINIGVAARNPGINELYSDGLHQGVSGIEEGDPNLNPERATKATASIRMLTPNQKLKLEGLVYYQRIQDYIYLQVQDEIRLTIRGAFPVFQYEQVDASLTGFDLSSSLVVTEDFNWKLKYSFLKGIEQESGDPLVFMPPNNLSSQLNFQLPNWLGFQNMTFELNQRIVFEQTNLLVSQDLAAAPATYALFGFKLYMEKQMKSTPLKFYLSCDNLLNSSYRDYLNRQRYFADELGRNISIGLSVSF